MTQHIIKNILSDIKVELADEFDRNFERKGFFGQQWKPRKFQSNTGSLMMQSGKLRRSIRASVSGNSVRFSSSEPYAAIHNEGGEIAVTAKMKKFFWAKYYQTKDEQWKWLALKKIGSKMTMPERRFLGYSPEVEKIITDIIKDNIEQFAKETIEKIKK